MAKQTVQISKEVVERLKKVTKDTGRSLNAEAEFGLKKYLESLNP